LIHLSYIKICQNTRKNYIFGSYRSEDVHVGLTGNNAVWAPQVDTNVSDKTSENVLAGLV
jgi:hypothetical protein